MDRLLGDGSLREWAGPTTASRVSCVGRGIRFSLRMFTCCILAALKPKFLFSNCAKNNILVSHRILPPDNSTHMSVGVDDVFNMSHTVDFLSNKAIMKAQTSGSML